MTFEVGRKYKTRDGREAIIYAIHEGQIVAIHGAIKNPPGIWIPADWSKEGLIYPEDEGSSGDLMPPEPKIETPDMGRS